MESNAITLPTDNLNSAVAGLAFCFACRISPTPEELLRITSWLALVPATLFCALFATDLILVLLGPRWSEAAAIFRLLAPSSLVLACINPMYWLLVSLGLIERSLKISLVIAPLVITSYLIGFHYGPRGVAFSYSAAMTLWMLPHIAWSVYASL
jgi:PST family polysaccharide transporter